MKINVYTRYYWVFALLFFISCAPTYHFNKGDVIHFSKNGYRIQQTDIAIVKKVKKSDVNGVYEMWNSTKYLPNWDMEDMFAIEILASNKNIYARKRLTDGKYTAYERVPISIKKNTISLLGNSYLLYKLTKDYKALNFNAGTKGLLNKYAKTDSSYCYIFNYTNIDNNDLVNDQYASGDYPEWSFVLLSEKEIRQYKGVDIIKIKNEMLARNGYSFENDHRTRLYYDNKKWYKSKLKFSKVDLSDIETQNLEILSRIQKK